MWTIARMARAVFGKKLYCSAFFCAGQWGLLNLAYRAATSDRLHSCRRVRENIGCRHGRHRSDGSVGVFRLCIPGGRHRLERCADRTFGPHDDDLCQ